MKAPFDNLYDDQFRSVIGSDYLKAFSLPVSFTNKSVNSDFIIDLTEQGYYIEQNIDDTQEYYDITLYYDHMDMELQQKFKVVDPPDEMYKNIPFLYIYERLSMSYEEIMAPSPSLKFETMSTHNPYLSPPSLQRSISVSNATDLSIPNLKRQQTVPKGGSRGKGKSVTVRNVYKRGSVITKRRLTPNSYTVLHRRASKKRKHNVYVRYRMNKGVSRKKRQQSTRKKLF